MTQSHLPRTGRGVVEAVTEMLLFPTSNLPAFSSEDAGFFVFPKHGNIFGLRSEPFLWGDSMKNSNEQVRNDLTAPSAPWKGSGTILLVEDEGTIRDIAKKFLEMFGFTVLEAENGKEALEVYQKNAAEITLGFTDMGMPVMDGYELFSELKKLNSDLPIIVSSGYGDAEVNTRIGINNIAGIVSKPYKPSQLRDVLKSVMEALPSEHQSQLPAPPPNSSGLHPSLSP